MKADQLQNAARESFDVARALIQACPKWRVEYDNIISIAQLNETHAWFVLRDLNDLIWC